MPESGQNAIESVAPRDNIVQVFPREIDLDNVQKLASFEHTHIVESIELLQQALFMRLAEYHDKELV